MLKDQKTPRNMQELTEGWVTEVQPPKNRAKRSRHAVGVICRDLGFASPEDCPLQEFPSSRPALKEIPRRGDSLQNDAGFRSVVSAAMNVLRYGLERGWLIPPKSAGQDLGFPNYDVQGRNGSEWNRAQWVWNRLIAFMIGHDRRFADLNHDLLLSFYGIIIQERGDLGRRDLRWFLQVVRTDVDADVLSHIDLPDLPTHRPKEYSLPLKEWPKKFHSGIAEIRDWLTGEMVEGRARRKRVRKVSADRDLKHLELLGGYVARIQGGNLAALDWQHLFAPDRVMGFLMFTDPEAEEHERNGQIPTGIYQEGLLNSFIKFLDGPLGLAEEAMDLRNLRFRFLFESKRTGPPKDLSPDTFFMCAAKVIDRAKDADSRGHTLAAATFRRDALLIALLALFPRRTDTAHRITLDQHLILTEDGLPMIIIPREDTKPEKRDSILEIPEELASLFSHYLNVDRPLLIGSCEGMETALFITQGGRPFCKGNARSIVRRRMNSEMGINIGPHSARHVWTPRFLLWSHGDYLSAMAVLDTSLPHIERAYRDAQETERAAGYFKNTEERWKGIENDRRNGNGTHSN